MSFENPVCREAGGVFGGSLLVLAMVCGCLQWFIRRAGGLAAKGRKKGAKKAELRGCRCGGRKLAVVCNRLQWFAVVDERGGRSGGGLFQQRG